MGGKILFFCDYPIIRGESELPLYLVNMGQHVCQDHIARREGYPLCQILYCTRGSGTLISEGKKQQIPAGTAVFLPRGYPHEYYPDGDVWDVHWIVPAGWALDGVLEHFGLTAPTVMRLREVNRLEHIFRKMHDAIISDSLFGNYIAAGCLYDFLIELYRQTISRDRYSEPSTALIKAVDYINVNYAQPIGLEDLCAVSGVSKQHLCLLFRSKLGARPVEYITKRRLQAAKELLVSSDKTVEEIAEETGFCTGSYFCKMFKRYEGITARQFKGG